MGMAWVTLVSVELASASGAGTPHPKQSSLPQLSASPCAATGLLKASCGAQAMATASAALASCTSRTSRASSAALLLVRLDSGLLPCRGCTGAQVNPIYA